MAYILFLAVDQFIFFLKKVAALQTRLSQKQVEFFQQVSVLWLVWYRHEVLHFAVENHIRLFYLCVSFLLDF